MLDDDLSEAIGILGSRFGRASWAANRAGGSVASEAADGRTKGAVFEAETKLLADMINAR